jgi:hypothetical protein
MRALRSTCLLFCIWAGRLAAQTGPAGVGGPAGNVLWLRAHDGITLTSGTVSQWRDQSGNNNHAMQPAGMPSARPVPVASSVNGYPSLDFDGTDDQLWVNDHSTLDLTQWHFFTVLIADLQKDYNAWMVKGDDGTENYELLSYADGNIHAPIRYTNATRTHPSSAGGQVTTTAFNVIEYSYSSAVGRDAYRNGANIITDNEALTPTVNNLPLYIGNERSSSGRFMNGDVAEIIAFNAPLNSAQRIIVNNYLAAKYGRPLSANDNYREDDVARGNYDHEVAGIGRVNAANLHTDARGTGIVRISNPTNLGNNEFLIWGHDNGVLGAWGVGDVPAGMESRFQRTWRVSERNAAGAAAVDVGAVDITFDLTGLGSVDPTELRLLVDSDQDGSFADEVPLEGAFNVSGNEYRFSAVAALVDGVRFTLGTTDLSSTPLPIELLFFEAQAEGPVVHTSWATATEQDNAHFIVERSTDGLLWYQVTELPGAGTSNQMLHYSAVDERPLPGTSYYRLRQTDLDGTMSWSEMRVVHIDAPPELRIHPNPGAGERWIHGIPAGATAELTVLDGAGRTVLHQRIAAQGGRMPFDNTPLPPGSYHLVVRTEDLVQHATFVVDRAR